MSNSLLLKGSNIQEKKIKGKKGSNPNDYSNSSMPDWINSISNGQGLFNRALEYFEVPIDSVEISTKARWDSSTLKVEVTDSSTVSPRIQRNLDSIYLGTTLVLFY